jgi:DNA-binding transcriptional LysR family regulator
MSDRVLPPICADCLLDRRIGLRQRSNACVITRKRGTNCNHSCYDILAKTITGTYMNLRQLEILRAVIRHRTTVAAADELALSQPAISNALKAMEAQTGFALFQRVNNRLFPTTEAMALYKESDAIFALHAKLENRVRDLRECRSGQLSIVATPPLAYSIIPPALSAFLRRRVQTRVFFDVRRYEGIIEGVLSRVAELGFVLGLSRHPGIAHEVVHTGDMVCVLPPKHPLAALPVISASDLVGLPFIGLERGTRLGEAVRDSFAQAGAPFQPTVEVRYCNTACVLAAAGVGAAVVDPFSPRQSSSQALIVRPFAPKTTAVAYMLWSEAEPLSRLAKAFLTEVRQASRVLSPEAPEMIDSMTPIGFKLPGRHSEEPGDG